MLEVCGLSVSYGDAVAVDDISLTVDQGEWVSLIGPNGAGKTSTLKAILGLVPHTGKIRMKDAAIDHLPPWKRQAHGLGYVPEGRRLFPELTVEDNLRAGGYKVSEKTLRGRIDHIYELFPHVRERRRQLAGTLSGGEQQMVALGRSLMSEPQLLLVDEASLGLMPINVNTVFAALARLHASGRAILLVEQNARKALKHVDRAYVMETGRLRLSGSASEVASNPRVIESYLG